MEPIRALEFFSGIGAMHYGLEWSGASGDVVASFDINPVANTCYKHNFGVEPIQLGIEHLSVKKLTSFDANAWFMSPPCQPYTRTGKQMDDQDPRAKGLLHLISQLSELPTPPMYLFLENVRNFEKSRTRDRLVHQLTRLGYDYTEWFLTPTQMGLPNDRGRYFLTARKVRDRLPEAEPVVVPDLDLRTEWPESGRPARIVGEFLEDDASGSLADEYQIPHAFVKRRQAFSESVVVNDKATRTSCFTKAYGHHGLAAGSYLQTKGFDDPKGLEGPSTAVERLGLRFFTPTE
ncbi:DNA (cytosine-5-)-methyltransferase [Powellomyces hirtus]|uniref:DNA (Cytosine-5-)-methyltransferase n=1 Tax=Powellomyces hirtus TaxID=109895 RepID=A0A507EGA4_9FUNG|nr:DNA (cytosine-5-)-methyltransferase [Powellomyces hirtus]